MRLAVDQFAESLQTHATNPPAAPGLPLYNLAKSLAKLLGTARRELDSDCEAAKAALVTASSILKSEIERNSGANGSRPGALAGWQIARVRAFIEENLHSNIDVRDLGVVAQQSPAHFSRSFKQAFGEPPHAYILCDKAASRESLSFDGNNLGIAKRNSPERRFCGSSAFVQAFPASVWPKPIDLAASTLDPGFNPQGPVLGRMPRQQKFTKPAHADQINCD